MLTKKAKGQCEEVGDIRTHYSLIYIFIKLSLGGNIKRCAIDLTQKGLVI
jgi:hypothetical protein